MIFCGHQQQQTLVQSHNSCSWLRSCTPRPLFSGVHTQPKTSTFTHPFSANEISFTLTTSRYCTLIIVTWVLWNTYLITYKQLSHQCKHSIPQNTHVWKYYSAHIVKKPFLVDFQKKHKFLLNLQIQPFPLVQSWGMTHLQCLNKNYDNRNRLTQVTHSTVLTFSQNFPYSPNTHFCYTRELNDA